MIKKLLLLLLSLSLVCACVKFSPIQLTRTLPNDIAERNNLIETAQWRSHLDDLVGAVLLESEDPQEGRIYSVSAGKFIASDATPVFSTFSETEGKLIEIIIDNKADAKLQYLALGSATLGAEEKLLFHYCDVSDVWIKYEQIDLEALKREAERVTDPTIKNRWFIQGALLSAIQKKVFTKVSGGLSKTVTGVGFSAEGGIYHSTSTFTKDYAIHLTLRHIDLFREPKNVEQQMGQYLVRRETEIEEKQFNAMLIKRPLAQKELALVVQRGLWINKLRKID
jgi:hypothetical protein